MSKRDNRLLRKEEGLCLNWTWSIGMAIKNNGMTNWERLYKLERMGLI